MILFTHAGIFKNLSVLVEANPPSNAENAPFDGVLMGLFHTPLVLDHLQEIKHNSTMGHQIQLPSNVGILQHLRALNFNVELVWSDINCL